MGNEETKTIKQFIITLIIVILIAVGIYFLTNNVVNKKTTDEEQEQEITYIDPTVVIVGTMLNKDKDRYYVLAYDKSAEDGSTYARLITSYKQTDKYVTTYSLDLSNPLNKNNVANEQEEQNLITENINELKIKGLTLFEIKNGKIVNAITNEDNIKKEWNINN